MKAPIPKPMVRKYRGYMTNGGKDDENYSSGEWTQHIPMPAAIAVFVTHDSIPICM